MALVKRRRREKPNRDRAARLRELLGRVRERLGGLLGDLEPGDLAWVLEYLQKFGWIDDGKLDLEKVWAALKALQGVLGLPATGLPDLATVKALRFTPRCGCPDHMAVGAGRRRWGLKKLTYFVERWVGGLSQSRQRELLRAVWDSWEAVCDLRFEESSSPDANLVISTGQGARDQFDGAAGTLAWAYLPPQENYRGQLLMRFDLAERWIDDPNERGILYRNVAAHEFGHLLGLDHSMQPQALMAPYYAPAIAVPQAVDDVSRIQALYGPPKAVPAPPAQPPLKGVLRPEHLTAEGLSVVRDW